MYLFSQVYLENESIFFFIFCFFSGFSYLGNIGEIPGKEKTLVHIQL